MSGGDWKADLMAEHNVDFDEVTAKAKQIVQRFVEAAQQVEANDFEMGMTAAFLVETILAANPALAPLAFKVGTMLIGASAPNLTPEQLVRMGAMPMPAPGEDEESVH